MNDKDRKIMLMADVMMEMLKEITGAREARSAGFPISGGMTSLAWKAIITWEVNLLRQVVDEVIRKAWDFYEKSDNSWGREIIEQKTVWLHEICLGSEFNVTLEKRLAKAKDDLSFVDSLTEADRKAYGVAKDDGLARAVKDIERQIATDAPQEMMWPQKYRTRRTK